MSNGDSLPLRFGDPAEAARAAATALEGKADVVLFLTHLGPEREDLLCVAVDDPAHLGERELAAGAGEQLLAELILEGMDLPAESRVRQAQHPAGARETAFPRDGEEVEQMMVVEPFHRSVG